IRMRTRRTCARAPVWDSLCDTRSITVRGWSYATDHSEPTAMTGTRSPSRETNWPAAGSSPTRSRSDRDTRARSAHAKVDPMRFGFWMPVFGGWLRNVEDEGMPATFDYQRDLAVRADHAGWDVTLVAELNLNDIKGPEADCLEAWTTAAALAPLTTRLELMTAVRPNFRLPALVAKEAATIDRIANGRFTLNVVSAWWATESAMYGGAWVEHDERYARTEEFISVLKGM